MLNLTKIKDNQVSGMNRGDFSFFQLLTSEDADGIFDQSMGLTDA